MNTIKILGVASSVRSRTNPEKIKEFFGKINNKTDFGYFFEKIGYEKVASNTEACLIAGLYGSLTEGADVDIVRLNKFFPADYPSRIKQESENELLNRIKNCDGMIIATPVYFGDRSSYAESFIKFLREQRVLEDKVVGVISVGAKRNGGQETTNVYTLWEMLNQGALVCGNGPKTSQYGGTGWAGDIGAIREDDFGMDTSIGVGRRVAQISEIIKVSTRDDLERFTVSFWITKDKNGILEKDIKRRIKYLKLHFPKYIEYRIINLTSYSLKRCLACNVCPHFSGEAAKYGLYKGFIQNDDMKSIYESLIHTDAIVVAGYNPEDTTDVLDVYQVFMERTRQIRRDNFILTNTPVAAYSMEELGQNSLFTLKVMTSYLRHNTIILPPITQYFSNGELFNDCSDDFIRLVDKILRIANGRSKTKVRKISYEAVGYLIKDLDDVDSYRK